MDYVIAVLIGAVIGYWVVQRIKYAKVGKIDVDQLAELLQEKSKDNIFVDVRDPNEYKQDKVKGMRNIPISQLKSRKAELPMDKNIYTFCQAGRRSHIAAKLLVREGYKNVATVKGGIQAWHARK